MCGPHHLLGRDAFASGPEILNASILEQGCPGFSPGSANRKHQITRHPWRTSPPLRPSLSFWYTQRLLSEMPNHVAAEEPEVPGIAIVEGRDIERPVIADLGADLELRANPMLPAGRDVDVARGIARALALHVIVELGAQREIVERADAIVPEGEQAEFVGGAGWQYGIADRLPRRVRHAVPRRAKIGIDRVGGVAGTRIGPVPHVALIHVIACERDVKLLVELVIVRAAVPVHVVVAPSGVVHVVDAEIDRVAA